MSEEDDKRQDRGAEALVRPAILVLGIALFVAGFLVTITAMSGGLGGQSEATSETFGDGGAESGTSSGVLMLIGFLLSMAGVVSATAGPAAYFVHNRRRLG